MEKERILKELKGVKGLKVVVDNRVNTPESLLTMGKNSYALIQAAEFASISTVRSAITRLNQQFGCKEFEVSTPDNGATLTIKRN